MIDPNEPAFPGEWVDQDPDNRQSRMYYFKGMTMRAYFAGKAMEGLRAAGLSDAITGSEAGRKLWSSTTIAIQALSDADAMIAELNK